MGKLHSNVYLWGITGSIGSGKSTVGRILEEWGVIRLDSDALARFYTDVESPIRKEIQEIFGESSFPEGKPADRAQIAIQAFAYSVKKKSLETLIHPRLRKDFLDKLKVFAEDNPGTDLSPAFREKYETVLGIRKKFHSTLVSWEVPLLFETDSYTLCDSTLTVWIPKDISWERVKSRGGISQDDFQKRWNSQMDPEKKKSLSEFSLQNDNTKEDLERNLFPIFQKILERL